MNYKTICNIIDRESIDSDEYMDAWDEARNMAYDNTFGNIGQRINPESVPDMLGALLLIQKRLSKMVIPNGSEMSAAQIEIDSAIKKALI